MHSAFAANTLFDAAWANALYTVPYDAKPVNELSDDESLMLDVLVGCVV